MQGGGPFAFHSPISRQITNGRDFRDRTSYPASQWIAWSYFYERIAEAA
jgi:hypothetical protein